MEDELKDFYDEVKSNKNLKFIIELDSGVEFSRVDMIIPKESNKKIKEMKSLKENKNSLDF